MTYLVSSKSERGVGYEVFATFEEALRVAKAFHDGLALILDQVSRQHWIYLEGVELQGEAATKAFREFTESQPKGPST